MNNATSAPALVPVRSKGIEVEQRIIQAIESGHYAQGMQLPSVREMADEVGVNKNTIVRIYHSLHKRGYVRIVQGSGTYVEFQSAPDDETGDDFEDEIAGATSVDRASAAQTSGKLWQGKLAEALRGARSAGVEQEKVTRSALAIIQRLYGNSERCIRFVECNQYDIDSLSHILEGAIGQSLEGLLINDFLNESEFYIANSDLIITTFFHINEVAPIVDAVDASKFIAVHAMPTQDALLDLARLQVPVLGIVADQARALDMMLHIVQTYQRTATIMSSSLDDQVRLQNLLDKADAIVVTQSRYPGLMKHNPQIPVVPISLTISQESINHLQQHLTQHLY